jgi:NAD(P)-dependent dehydrogenase (short-subunit alcohol dehydrogenase family)
MGRPEYPPMFLSTRAPDLFTGSPAALRTHPELAGKRVLLTGVTAAHGIDIARAFAEQGVRLILQVDDVTAETETLVEVLAPEAAELHVEMGRLAGPDAVVAFARRAASVFGGLDIVVNIVTLTLDPWVARDDAALESRVSDVLTAPCLVARIAANRMKLFHVPGQILHVAVLPDAPTAAERTFAALVRPTLAAMTRADATTGAADGIRVNAIAPVDAADPTALGSEPDVAALALHLAAGRGHALSGLMFDAAL